MTWRDEMKALLTRAFLAGVEAAHPGRFLAHDDVRAALHDWMAGAKSRVLVLGAGKASAAMATALEREWASLGGLPLEGLVVTRAGYETKTGSIEIATGGHPHPSSESAEIAARMLKMAKDLTADDLLIGLWSGGGSSLLAAPPETLPFEEFLVLTKSLLTSGADIHEINTTRKHLSRISGGRLAQAAAPASLLNLVIPDVAGGDDSERLSAIASGPCMPDPTTVEDARTVLARYGLDAAAKALSETPKTWAEMGVANHSMIVMENALAIDGAAAVLKEAGFTAASTEVTGEARDAAKAHATCALKLTQQDARAAIVTSGELTVTVEGSGKGGPNQEYALTLALALEGTDGIAALAGDTDGIDGIGEAAGAFVFPDTLERMRKAGIDPEAALDNNDSGTAFAAIGDLLITGPTFTNVNDLRLIVINGLQSPD